MSFEDQLLTNRQVAELLGISPTTLEIWRCRGKGPAFVKYGARGQSPVRYRLSVVMQWMGDNSYSSTSAHTVAVSNAFEDCPFVGTDDGTSTKSNSCSPTRATA